MKRPRITVQPDHVRLNRNNRSIRAVAGFAIVLTIFLEGCASAPKDYWGTWRPINRYQQTSTSIPLNADYMYYATPLDGTLRTMLQRWAKDSSKQLSYQLQSDYTLTQPASLIRTADIHRALVDLNEIYAPQGILLYTVNNEILAKPALGPSRPHPAAAGLETTSSVLESEQSKPDQISPANTSPTHASPTEASAPMPTTRPTRTQ